MQEHADQAKTEAQQQKEAAEDRIKEIDTEITTIEANLKEAREKIETQLKNKEITKEQANARLDQIKEGEKKIGELKLRLADEKEKVKQLNTLIEGN